MRTVTYQYKNIDEEALLETSATSKANHQRSYWNIWKVLNVIVWIFAIFALFWIFQNRVPNSFKNEIGVGGEKTGGSKAWDNLGASVLHVRQNKPQPVDYTPKEPGKASEKSKAKAADKSKAKATDKASEKSKAEAADKSKAKAADKDSEKSKAKAADKASEKSKAKSADKSKEKSVGQAEIRYGYSNWQGRRFSDREALRMDYTVVMPILNTGAIGSQISARVNANGQSQIIAGIRVEEIDLARHQVLVTTPRGEALLDCLRCMISGEIEGCDCFLLSVIPSSTSGEESVGQVTTNHGSDAEGGLCQVTSDQAVVDRDCGSEWPASRCCADHTVIQCPDGAAYNGVECYDYATCNDDGWSIWTCANECLGGSNEVQTPNGATYIDDLKILDYVQTGSKSGVPVYSQVVYLVKKHHVQHLKIETSGGEFSIVTHNHIVPSQRGKIGAGQLTEKDSLRTEDGTLQRVVSIEPVLARAHTVRTSDPSGMILTNGIYVTENSLPGDVEAHRKIYNFIIFKLCFRLPFVAYFFHYFPSFASTADTILILIPALLLSSIFRRKDRESLHGLKYQ